VASRDESLLSEIFFGAVYGLGLSATIWTLVGATGLLRPDPLAFVTLGALTGLLRPLRTVRGFPFVIAAVVLFGPAAALLTAVLAALLASFSRARRRRAGIAHQPVFEVSVVALAATAASGLYTHLGGPIGEPPGPGLAGPLAVFAVVYAAVELTLRLLAARWSAGGARGRRVMRMLAGYTAGLLVAPLLVAAYRYPPTRVGLYLAPSLLLCYALGRLHAERRAVRRRRRRRSAAIYRSITDALARALVARDDEFGEHLRRVRRLCLAVGRRMDLAEGELEALGTGALLHDVGKIAVPERILAEPRRLTAAEMERVRVHPGVGSDIVEAIGYPYPVHPIVKHHHERWDGQGYPGRLAGDEIPLGARILAAVDCYDALTTDRPYRRALDRDEALAYLIAESGKMFDPQVVETLLACLPRAERDAAHGPSDRELPAELPLAERELYALNEISELVRGSTHVNETLTLVAGKLGGLVPFESLVVLRRDSAPQHWRVCFALGRDAGRVQDRVLSLASPVDQVTTGEIEAELRSRLADGASGLRSAAAAPILQGARVTGLLALFDLEGRRFQPRERRLLASIAALVAEALCAVQATPERRFDSLTDPATGLPNARFLRLEAGYRMSVRDSRASGFGLLAFEADALERVPERRGSERLLGAIARRLACACEPGETLVRFGQEQFLVLSGTARSGELVQRFRDLVDAVERQPITIGADDAWAPSLCAAHASYPLDGPDLDTLLIRLGARLALARDGTRSILPFPVVRSAG
jgi:GGDEF domain-containing protein